MITKNINSIFFSKSSLVFKIVLYILILTFVASLLGFSIIAPISKGLRADIEKVGIGQKFFRYVEASLTGQDYDAARIEFINAMTKIDDIMATWNGEVIGAIVTFIIILIMFSILYFMSYYPITDIVNHFMSSNSKFGFGANYVANAKKSFIFSLFYTLYVYGIYLVGFGVAAGLGLLIGRVAPMLGFFITYLLAIATLALRRSLTPYWLPAMVAKDMSVHDAFYKNFELLHRRFWKTFGAYFMLYLVGIAVFLASAILTFGVATIFMFCGIWLYMHIRDLVSFYHVNEMKYYIDEQTVVNPKKVFRDAIMDDDNFKL